MLDEMNAVGNTAAILTTNSLDFSQVFILAVVQGLTEFLPISSSAHLILVPKIFGWPDQGISFDIAVHLGTLIALLGYFHREIAIMCRDFYRSLLKKEPLSPYAKMMWAIGFATIPVGLAGLLFKDKVETVLRSPFVIAITTIVFGLLLWLADRMSQKLRDEKNMNWKDVLMIGLGQTLSLVPGTSRSGITLTAGLAMGLTREAAARFSFLLAIPVILLAGGYESLNLIKGQAPVNWQILSMGILFSALSGYACIYVFLKLLNKVGVFPFVIYRLILGGLLLSFFV